MAQTPKSVPPARPLAYLSYGRRLDFAPSLHELDFHSAVQHMKNIGGGGLKKKREPTSPPPLNRTAAIRYLWPECVIRAMMSRRLSATVAPANSARSAGLHLLIVVLIAVAHLSMPSALG